MALFSVKGPNIPKDHFPLSRDEAVSFQLDIVSTLAPAEHRYFIQYGPEITSTIGFLGSLSITRFYRNCVQIGNYKKIHTSIPCTILPSLIHLALHKRFVRDNIIIQKWACAYCYHIKSALFQVFFGVALPIATSAITSFAVARRLKRPGVPALNKPEIYQFFIQKTRPFSRVLAVITLLQFVAGVGMAQAEAAENNYFNENIERFIADYEKNEKNALEAGPRQKDKGKMTVFDFSVSQSFSQK